MQRTRSPSRIPKPDTQPAIVMPAKVMPAKPRLLMLYGSGTAVDTIHYLDRLAASTTLKPRILNMDENSLSARQAVTRLTRNTHTAAHMMLCVHGSVAPRALPQARCGRHALSVTKESDDIIETRRLLQWVTRSLADSGKENSAAPSALPFIHLFSCGSGVLRKQLLPGSALWRSAYFLTYASKRPTSLSACGPAMSAAIGYIDLCQRHRRDIDALKLLYLAGLRRGECMTLMGGELSEPLVWHAPKSEADLSEPRSIAALRGNAKDIARLHQQVAGLTADERALLPAPALRELLSSRLQRDDDATVATLLDAHPELRDRLCVMGVSPVIEAADKRANRCLALLLERGADPDTCTADTSALQMCALGPDYNLKGLALLLGHGADPNLVSPDGTTALGLAVHQEWIEGIRYLVSHGARMSQESDGLLCLEAAALDGKARSVDCLLELGASAADGLQPSLVDETLEEGFADIADMLRRALKRREDDS